MMQLQDCLETTMTQDEFIKLFCLANKLALKGLLGPT